MAKRYASEAAYHEAIAQQLVLFLVAAWNRRWPAEAITVSDRLREPQRCRRCPATGPFTYDEETHTWICHTCAATWPAGVDEVGR